VDLADELGQDGGLVAGPGPDLEDLLRSIQAERFVHEGDDLGLGNGLPLADGQGLIGVSRASQVLRDEEMTGDFAHGRQDPLVANAPGPDLLVNHSSAL
jgi:hypothetical protein